MVVRGGEGVSVLTNLEGCVGGRRGAVAVW